MSTLVTPINWNLMSEFLCFKPFQGVHYIHEKNNTILALLVTSYSMQVGVKDLFRLPLG